jgi:hypothetical protein
VRCEVGRGIVQVVTARWGEVLQMAVDMDRLERDRARLLNQERGAEWAVGEWRKLLAIIAEADEGDIDPDTIEKYHRGLQREQALVKDLDRQLQEIDAAEARELQRRCGPIFP